MGVIFKEDYQLKQKENFLENCNMMIKVALTLLDNEKSTMKFKVLLGDSCRELIMNLYIRIPSVHSMVRYIYREFTFTE